MSIASLSDYEFDVSVLYYILITHVIPSHMHWAFPSHTLLELIAIKVNSHRLKDLKPDCPYSPTALTSYDSAINGAGSAGLGSPTQARERYAPLAAEPLSADCGWMYNMKWHSADSRACTESEKRAGIHMSCELAKSKELVGTI